MMRMFIFRTLKSGGVVLTKPIESHLMLKVRNFNKYNSQKFRTKNFRAVAGLVAAGICLTGTKVLLDSESKEAECEYHESEVLKKRCYIKGMNVSLDDAVRQARDLVQRIKDEVGAPGLVVGVSIDGETVWEEGFGYSDVENRIPCTPETVMRIASISKSMTMTAVAKLWEEGKLDLDAPVQTYVPIFPEKKFDGNKVVISTRYLVSHMSGIRHYDKNPKLKNKTEDKTAEKNINSEVKVKDANKKDDESTQNEFALKEYYIKDEYDSVTASLDIFKNDPLIFRPGTTYLYTTHGFTLLSAVVEGASKVCFTDYMSQLFNQFGLRHTYLDKNEPLIYNRSRNYIKKKSRLVNAPYVDNSYKWAGGGFLSTVGDLLKFGNIMLYSYQYDLLDCNSGKDKIESSNLKSNETQQTKETAKISTKPEVPGFLKSTTVKMMWSPVVPIDSPNRKNPAYYGMGWCVIPERYEKGYGTRQQYYVTHSGGAVGASSQLLILPRDINSNTDKENKIPNGIIVTLITNLVNVKLEPTALEIAKLFEKVAN